MNRQEKLSSSEAAKREYILSLLAPMKEQARREGKVFRKVGMHSYIELTPDKLDEHNANGEFLWGPDNWRLADPSPPCYEMYGFMVGVEDEYTGCTKCKQWWWTVDKRPEECVNIGRIAD